VDEEMEMFEMGEDEDFDGLRPEREVGEDTIPSAATGQNVFIEPGQRQQRQLGRVVARLNNRRGTRGRGGRAGRGRRPEQGRPVPQDLAPGVLEDEDERQEEERLYKNNLASGSASPSSSREASREEGSRRVRCQVHVPSRPDNDDEMAVDTSTSDHS